MKVVCTQENLKSGLSQITRIVGSSSTLPILNNVLLETENGLLKISGTNLEIGISTFIRCKVDSEGSICLGAKTLYELVQSLPNEHITIETSENETSIYTSRYNTKIKHLSSEDFPVIPKIEQGLNLNINQGILRKSLAEVLFAVSTSETQPEISGILWNFQNTQLVLTATDRYRLAEKKIPVNSPESKKVIMPHKSALELTRLMVRDNYDLSLQITNTQFSAMVGDTYLVSRLVDANYPDYEQIIPKDFKTVCEVETNQLKTALRTSGIFSKNVGNVNVFLNSDSQLIEFNSSSHDVGESKINIESKITGESNSVILNYRYMLDVLTGTSSEYLKIMMVDDSNPILIKTISDENYLYLIMPIRT